MDVYHLPNDIFSDKKYELEAIIIHEYAASTASFKGRSILHRNAISLVLEGEKKMHFIEKTILAKDDAFHFLSMGNCLVSMDIDKKQLFKSILIFFDGKVLADFYLKYDVLISHVKGVTEIRPELYISFKKDEFIHNYISSLQLLLKNVDEISFEMQLLKFEELMLYLLKKYPRIILGFQNGKNNNLNDFQIKRTVESNITSNLQLEELAFLFNVSLSTFKRLFFKIYGISPNKWFLKRRMEIAANLLTNYREKPGEIFYKAGYENHSSFTHSFKQVFGITPREYQVRKMNV